MEHEHESEPETVEIPTEPHNDETPAWAKDLINKVDSLESKVESMTLANVPGTPSESEPDTTPDTKPHSVPWTHKGGGHHE